MRATRIFFSLLAFVSARLFGEAPNAANVTDVTPDEVEKLLEEKPGITVLDVRTDGEFKAGHIPGAKNVNFFDDNFATQVAALDPATPIIILCAAGGRSAQSLPYLQDKKAVYHLKAGFNGWAKAGKRVEK